MDGSAGLRSPEFPQERGARLLTNDRVDPHRVLREVVAVRAFLPDGEVVQSGLVAHEEQPPHHLPQLRSRPSRRPVMTRLPFPPQTAEPNRSLLTRLGTVVSAPACRSTVGDLPAGFGYRVQER